MATTTSIPVSEYLRTAYRPDVDYLEGEIQERTLGTQLHSMVQKMIAAIFLNRRREWGLRSLTEQRVQVRPTRFRIPDVCVVPSSSVVSEVLTQPPLLCVEVLSPDDTFASTQARVQDFLEMGVPVVWIIDPVSRLCWTCTRETGAMALGESELTLQGTAVRITLAEIFEEIDESPGIGVNSPLDPSRKTGEIS